MTQDKPAELSRESFAALAGQLGLRMSPERLDALYPDVQALLGRIAPLWDIDVSSVTPEEAMQGPGGAL